MVFPVWDHNPFTAKIKPWVTWGLIALNTLVYLIELGSSPDIADAHLDAAIAAFGVTPASIFHDVKGAGPFPVEFDLISYQFLHANFLHLLGNMVFLWVFGDDVEEALGHLRYIAFYLLCGIGAGAAYVLAGPHSTIPLVGASGSIAGVLAAYLMFRPCQKVWIILIRFPVHLAAYWVIGGWILMQIWSVSVQSDDGVSYMAHVGGLISGAVLFFLMRPVGTPLFECIKDPPKPPPLPPMPPAPPRAA